MFSRRVLLKSSGLALVSMGSGPWFLDRLARATETSWRRPRVLVSIFLRGAMDGLMAVPPLTEPTLKRLRPRLAMSATRSAGTVLDLDGRFGLHPALAPLWPLWADGRLAIVHAVGSPNTTRSHFDAQDYMETGTPGRKGTPSGWLNRVASLRAGTSPLRAVSLTPTLPRALYGDQPAVAIPNLSDFRFARSGDRELAAETRRQLEELYTEEAGDLLGQRGREMFEAMKILDPREIASYERERAARYPRSRLGRSLLQIAYLIRKGAGLELAFTESGGWDTHVSQGTVEGSFARRAGDLARSLTAFWNDIEPYHDDVVVMTMTEFGRTVAENGSGGTDHGHGSCLFVLGNRVDGGRVYGEFPGGETPSLDRDLLYQGRDLPVTTDFRAVFSEVAGKLFDIRDDELIFPGWTGLRLPILW